MEIGPVVHPARLEDVGVVYEEYSLGIAVFVVELHLLGAQSVGLDAGARPHSE